MRRVAVILALALCLAGLGCKVDTEETGVVAKVNGRPILLSRLEARYDMAHLGGFSGAPPSVGKLRKEYAALLAEMVAQELVAQELEARGLSVTEAEWNHYEATVRADYPKGGFEQVLVEEYIDLDVWRDHIHADLAQEKFLTSVLRPGITLDYQEAEAYYKEHIKDFVLPPRLHFLLITGPSKRQVKKTVDTYLEERLIEGLDGRFEQVNARELTMRADRLSTKWKDVLASLSPGKASPVAASQTGFEALVLLEQIPEKVLDPTQAYPIIEKILLERKLEEAYRQWLAERLRTAKIVVSPHLLPQASDEEEDAASAPGTEGQESKKP